MRPVLRVALTGGIASGKSTVAALFADLGVRVIDLDDVAREVVAPGTALLEQVLKRFGPQMRLPNGTLDRRALREVVFNDPQARRDLEALLHPAIRARMEEHIAAAHEACYVMIVIPLLAESGSAGQYDRVLLIDCDESTQHHRLAARDGGNDAMVNAALAAQASRAERQAVATDVILNDGAVEALRPQVEKLHAQFQQLARDRGGTIAGL